MVVGWIPKAFVKPLTPGLADRLRDIREDLRPQELEQAEHDRNSSPVRRAMNSIDSGLNRSLPPSYRQTSNQVCFFLLYSAGVSGSFLTGCSPNLVALESETVITKILAAYQISRYCIRTFSGRS